MGDGEWGMGEWGMGNGGMGNGGWGMGDGGWGMGNGGWSHSGVAHVGAKQRLRLSMATHGRVSGAASPYGAVNTPNAGRRNVISDRQNVISGRRNVIARRRNVIARRRNVIARRRNVIARRRNVIAGWCICHSEPPQRHIGSPKRRNGRASVTRGRGYPIQHTAPYCGKVPS